MALNSLVPSSENGTGGAFIKLGKLLLQGFGSLPDAARHAKSTPLRLEYWGSAPPAWCPRAAGPRLWMPSPWQPWQQLDLCPSRAMRNASLRETHALCNSMLIEAITAKVRPGLNGQCSSLYIPGSLTNRCHETANQVASCQSMCREFLAVLTHRSIAGVLSAKSL